ncbi:hypothetical protein JHK87_040013 [Glycine soja]|nr:hypothetical protein JHK87_040013 [Glycine soja]
MVPFRFNTIGVNGAISMGTHGIGWMHGYALSKQYELCLKVTARRLLRPQGSMPSPMRMRYFA